jgi:RNA polymerase sigma factor (sigma-70 family)
MITLTRSERDALIIENLPLADKIAKSKKKKLSHISFAELQSAAYLGLVEAAQSYQPENNDCFPAFAVWRIIGSVRDYLRELSWGTRANPQKMEYLSSEDEFTVKENTVDFEFFEDLIKLLPSVSKTVMRLYYLEDKKIAEIAEMMDVHQSRVSQILSDSRNRLYNTWEDHQPELWRMVA